MLRCQNTKTGADPSGFHHCVSASLEMRGPACLEDVISQIFDCTGSCSIRRTLIKTHSEKADVIGE